MRLNFKIKFVFFHICGSYKQYHETLKKKPNAAEIQTHTDLPWNSYYYYYYYYYYQGFKLDIYPWNDIWLNWYDKNNNSCWDIIILKEKKSMIFDYYRFFLKFLVFSDVLICKPNIFQSFKNNLNKQIILQSFTYFCSYSQPNFQDIDITFHI